MQDSLPLIPLIPLRICEKLESFAFAKEGKEVCVATCNPKNIEILKDFLPPLALSVLEITPEEFAYHLDRARVFEVFGEICNQISQDEDLAIQRLLDLILQEAIKKGSSDIHLENTLQDVCVRIRIDSVMQELFVLERAHFLLLSSSLKLECSLDIHEKRKPQDGRFSRVFEEEKYDFRLSCVPTSKGESLVIRILRQESSMFNLASLGFSSLPNLDLPYGLVFVTGPTGSGKSTTLYAILQELKSIEKKIITLEDPIEYDLELLTQVAICEKHGFGFKEALRFVLRQDPDVIMVGEIRDQESLALAIQASLTGHLVFSTLHTNDALSSIERLLDMDAKPYLIASTLHLIIAQRLVRKLCPHCKVPASSVLKEMVPANYRDFVYYQPKGCHHCHFKGYRGRILIYEILSLSQRCKTLIAQDASKEELLRLLREENFVSLFEDGIKKASRGETSLEEILRATYEI